MGATLQRVHVEGGGAAAYSGTLSRHLPAKAQQSMLQP